MEVLVSGLWATQTGSYDTTPAGNSGTRPRFGSGCRRAKACRVALVGTGWVFPDGESREHTPLGVGSAARQDFNLRKC